MRHLRSIQFALAMAIMAAVVLPAGTGRAQDPNGAPNPYRMEENWAKLPEGRKWGSTASVEVDPDGKSIWTFDRCAANDCIGSNLAPIQKFDAAGKLLLSFGANMFIRPHGIHVDRQGNVWVSDQSGKDGKGHQVFKFSPEGKVLMTLGKAGVASAEPGLFDEPTDVVVNSRGEIFISEGHSGGTKGNDRIQKFDKNGKFLKMWGTTGSGPENLHSPHSMAFDSKGRLFVADRDNNRIQIFDQEGRLLDSWKQWSRPSGLFIAPDDTMYVADSESWGPDNPGWKKGIRIGSAKDGSVKYFIEDMESMTQDHSGAESVGVDKAGNVYGGVVRRQMLERHTKK